VRWQQTDEALESRLNGVLIDRFRADENAGYPTLCKGRFAVGGHTFHALESLNTLDLLPKLRAAGVKAIKLEGRQRSPAYTAQITRVWRQALDALERDPQGFRPRPEWQQALGSVSEGSQTTLGAYHRPWQ
jgi:collagenase-like PrtC family protease